MPVRLKPEKPAQTIKLFKVCSERGIPIFTFINKLDRAGKHPFELMEELENVLGIRSCPINWPIGTDGDFKGVYNRAENNIELYSGGSHGQKKVDSVSGEIGDEAFKTLLGEHYHKRLMEEIELLDVAGDALDMDKVLKGRLTPLFFGSAMNNFGVESFLKKFLDFTPPPSPRQAGEQFITPEVNANKEIKLAQPQQFMAQERESVEKAYPGDIIGLFDPGVFGIGDTVCTGAPILFDGIPLFAPEHFARVYTPDTMKRKQFIKGIEQLSQAGAIQVFKETNIGREELIIGVVGMLQLEVLQYRLKAEYNAEVNISGLPYKYVRWIKGAEDVSRLKLSSSAKSAQDGKGRAVILFENDWSIRWALENNSGLELTDTMPR